MGTVLLTCAFLITLLLSACHYQWLQNQSSGWRRAGFASGLAAVASPTILAGIWPSAHAFLALPALPALVVFVVGIFSPGIASRAWVRVYGLVAVVLASLAWCLQLCWWLFIADHVFGAT